MRLLQKNDIFKCDMNLTHQLVTKFLHLNVYICSKWERGINNINNNEIIIKNRGLQKIKINKFKNFITIHNNVYFVIANYVNFILLVKCNNYKELDKIYNS